MFGIPLPQLGIIAVMVVIALSMVPASVWPKLPEIKPLPDSKPVDTSNKYLAVQKMLLDARAACGECPEAITAIDAAIRATVAMVVRQ